MCGRTIWTAVLVVIGLLAWSAPRHPTQAVLRDVPARQSRGLTITGPASCPSSGCAPGQRIDLVYNFSLSAFTPSTNANVMVCVYVPTSWNTSTPLTDPITGEDSGAQYALRSDCAGQAAPDNYRLLEARDTAINQNVSGDALNLSFRLYSAPDNRQVIAELYENANAAGFTRTDNSSSDQLRTAAPSNVVFVANDAAACGANTPCYLNSAADLPGGIGTGLRDAVDAVVELGIVNIIGNYSMKTNTVLVNRAVTLTGINDSALTFTSGGSCSAAMLSLRAGVTLRGLNINDGTCTGPNRDLVEVDSSANVIIEYNDLTAGGNAITLADNSGAVTIQYNNITGNSGFAVFAEGHTAGGRLDVIANNLQNNRPGDAVQCSSSATQPLVNRKISHNYFGSNAPTAASTNCTIDPGKRLGAPITLRTNVPGVNVLRVDVTDSKRPYFENQISVRRSGGDNFPLYIVDHGYLIDSGLPFSYAAGLDSPYPCSNAWDVFLPDGVNPDATLELAFKYNKSSTCISVINSNLYCGQSTAPALYPLYWFDPATGATNSWDTTGQRPEKLTTGDGQQTTCNIGESEIQVAIDRTGRPALDSDLNYTPFLVAIPLLRSFQSFASSQTVTSVWTTNNEPDISGFYVLRSLDGVNFSPVSDFISRRGSALQGITSPAYSFTNANLVNGVTYFYRLQIVRTDGRSMFSAINAVIANVATISPTPTVTPTRTITPIPPTLTPSRTFVPQQFPTLIPSGTVEVQTPVPSITSFVFGTAYPVDGEQATLDETQAYEQSLTPATEGTPIAMLPATITPGVTSTDLVFDEPTSAASQPSRPWLSLGLGLLAGTVIVGGLAAWWWMTKLR